MTVSVWPVGRVSGAAGSPPKLHCVDEASGVNGAPAWSAWALRRGAGATGASLQAPIAPAIRGTMPSNPRDVMDASWCVRIVELDILSLPGAGHRIGDDRVTSQSLRFPCHASRCVDAAVELCVDCRHLMDTQVGKTSPMRSPERWLAFLRIAVGIWFAKAIFTKLSITLAWGFLPLPTASDRWIHVMPLLVTKYADGNPVGFFREFLQATVVSHGTLFAQLTAFGEAAVGVGLLFGCLTTLASAIGLLLVLNYGLAVQWQGSSQQGFHYMLIATLVVLLAVRAGRTWGVDGWVRTHHPGSWLARDPLPHLRVDHRDRVGPPVRRVQPCAVRGECDAPWSPADPNGVDHRLPCHVHDADTRGGAFREIGQPCVGRKRDPDRLGLTVSDRELAEHAVRGHVDERDVPARLGGDPRATPVRRESHGPVVLTNMKRVQYLSGLGMHHRDRVVLLRGDVQLLPVATQPDRLGLDAHRGREQDLPSGEVDRGSVRDLFVRHVCDLAVGTEHHELGVADRGDRARHLAARDVDHAECVVLPERDVDGAPVRARGQAPGALPHGDRRDHVVGLRRDDREGVGDLVADVQHRAGGARRQGQADREQEGEGRGTGR